MRSSIGVGMMVLTGLVFASASASAQTALPRAGWVATASTTNAGEPASRAIDGSGGTRWSTGTNQTMGQWFSIDMQTPQTFSQVTIDPAGSANDWTRAFQVFVSNDAVNWGAPVASGSGTSGVLTIVFPTQTARFVGIVQTTSGSNWWSIGEINVYSSGAAPSVPLATTGWIATASATGGSDVPSRAIDGSLGTRWTTGASQVNGQWFQLDMLQTRTLNKLTLNSDGATNDYPRGYQLFVSNSTSSWGSPVASGTATSSLLTVTFAAASGRYLKVVQTGSASSWWSIAELTAYAVGTLAPTPVALPRTGWTATASSVCQNDTPNKALDDNGTTRWSSGLNQASGQFFQLDMQAPRLFSRITVDAGTSNGDYPRAFGVYATNDTASWGSPIATGSGSGQLVTIDFAYQNARYLKIVETGSSSTNWWSIHELNVYGVAPTVLIREGWQTTASLGNAASHSAIDGSLDTRWTTGVAQANGQSFVVDMLAPQSFNQLVLDATHHSTDYPRGYQVFVSNDGTTWGAAVASGTATAALVSIGLPTQVARYFKVVQTGSSSSSWSIDELDVLYSPGSADLVTPVLVCVTQQDPTLFSAVFSYNNAQASSVTIPVGPSNSFSPGPALSGQPQVFLPGSTPKSFAVDFDGTPLTWRLGSRVVVASSSSPACPAVTCPSRDLDIVNGNYPGCFASDTDKDGVPDVVDNCPSLQNPNQADQDGDTLGDLCDGCADVDHDGLCDNGALTSGMYVLDSATELLKSDVSPFVLATNPLTFPSHTAAFQFLMSRLNAVQFSTVQDPNFRGAGGIVVHLGTTDVADLADGETHSLQSYLDPMGPMLGGAAGMMCLPDGLCPLPRMDPPGPQTPQTDPDGTCYREGSQCFNRPSRAPGCNAQNTYCIEGVSGISTPQPFTLLLKNVGFSSRGAATRQGTGGFHGGGTHWCLKYGVIPWRCDSPSTGANTLNVDASFYGAGPSGPIPLHAAGQNTPAVTIAPWAISVQVGGGGGSTVSPRDPCAPPMPAMYTPYPPTNPTPPDLIPQFTGTACATGICSEHSGSGTGGAATVRTGWQIQCP